MRLKIYGAHRDICLIPTTYSGALNRLWESFRSVLAAWTGWLAFFDTKCYDLLSVSTYWPTANASCRGSSFYGLGLGKESSISWRDMFKIEDCLLLLRGIKNIPTSPIGSFLYVQAEM